MSTQATVLARKTTETWLSLEQEPTLYIHAMTIMMGAILGNFIKPENWEAMTQSMGKHAIDLLDISSAVATKH